MKNEKWETFTAKKIREKTGLTQQKFAEKFEIPVRTIEKWETGERVPADYVVTMLAKVADLENCSVTGWIFSEYRDKKGVGTTKIFPEKEAAIEYAKKEWERLDDADQASYKEDPAAWFHVAEYPLIWDDENLDFEPATDDYTPVWSAF